MDWSSMFRPMILAQGKNYYAAGRVKDVIQEENGYSMTVSDSGNYFVTAILDGHHLLGIGCTCSDAESGLHCKHEAATLFMLENKLGRIELPANQSEDESNSLNINDSGFSTTSPVGTNLTREDRDRVPVDPSSIEAIGNLSRDVVAGRNFEAVPESAALDYQYFDADHFTEGLNLSREIIGEAQQLIKSKEYKPIRINLFYQNEEEGEDLVGEAFLDSPDSDFRKWQANIRFNADRITDSYCSSIRCHYRYDRDSYLERTLCRHQVAAILLTQKYLRENNPGDATNSAGMQLISMLRGAYQAGEGEEDGRISAADSGILTIEPYLMEGDNNSLLARFRIGDRRLYKIQNIPETVKNIRLHREQTFGSGTTLLLGREYIAEESKPWLTYLEGIADDERLKAMDFEDKFHDRLEGAQEGKKNSERFLAARKLLEMTDSVSLFGEKLDRFYEIAKDSAKPIEVTLKTGKSKQKQMLVFEDRNPDITLEIHKDMDEKRGFFRGIILEGDCPEILQGRERAYYIRDGGFYGIEEDRYRECKPIFDVAKNGHVKIKIGRIHLRDFYYRILPGLKKMINIVEHDHDEIAAYLPPLADFITYLDVEDKMIVARCDVYYGEKVHPLTDIYQEDKGEKRLESYRDREAEWQVGDILSRYLTLHDEEYNLFYCERKDEKLFDFLDKGIGELLQVSEVHMTDRFKRLKLRDRARIHMDVSVGNNLMDLRVSSEDLSREDLLDILSKYKQKRRFARLQNGDYFKIDENETVEALGQIMDNLQLSPGEFVEGKMHIPAYRALYLDRMTDRFPDVILDRDEHFKELIKEFKTIEEADFEIPPSLREILRKYQKTGYRWLRTLDGNAFGGILADDMGLGKTLQMITLLLADKMEHLERSEEEPDTALIVCPASLVYNWSDELERFAPSLIVRTLAGSREEREKQIADYKDVDVLITSYDLLRRDIACYEDCLFRFVVADEAQYIKNYRTAAARSLKLVRGVTRFALTGTPIENRLSELWSIFDFLMPGFLYDYPTFRDDYEIPITRYHDEEATNTLKRMVTPFILRRMKEDVLYDLPEKMEEKLTVHMGEEQQHLYDGQVVELINTLQSQTGEEFARNKIRILADLMRLRQICCDPSLCFEDYTGGSAKKEICMELIRRLPDGGHKALVFSQFTSMLAILERELKEEEIPYYKITGATPKARRVELVNAFNQDDTPVFLISLKAGGTGLNLTGADVVIHFDPWWNTAAENQATDRTYRIGQTRPVNVYRLIAKGSIEDRIVELQRSKKNLADLVMAAEEVGTTQLSKEDLLELLDEQAEKAALR